MKKYFNKEGVEFKEGDFVMLGGIDKKTSEVGYQPVIITEKLLEKLVHDGVLSSEEGGTHLDIIFYVEHLAERIGWNVENLAKYLDNLYKIYPTAVFHILLREVAIVLDQKYPDHIERSEEIWFISTTTGKIHRMKESQRERVVNFKNFAAFRTLDDAKVAMHILKVPMKELFERPKKKGGKQKN